MDWPKFDFCVLLWVLCVSKALGDSTALISTKEPKCQWGDILPRKDECNTCICFEGDVHCTNLPCTRQRTGEIAECWEGQPVIKLDECNECFCFDGKLDCSDLICIRGSKCSDGQEIPRPDHCNICKCFEGHIVCTNYECNPRSKHRPYLTANATTDSGAMKDAEIPKECEENDFIPPPPPPFDCNKCVCLNHQVFCSMESCTDDVPDVNTRFNLQNEPKDNLEVHDKKISVDPYLNLFYKNYDKTPTKLVHTHAYNGFHQEIKVHSKNLSQDTSKLIKALASSLDNPVLGQIGDRIKTSSSNLNSHELTKLSGGQGGLNYIPNSPHSNEIQAKHSPNLSDNPLHSLSSLITSGSQSNETILVIPSKQKPFAANQQPHLNTPYSSESADLTFEQKNLYYPANHPSNVSPRDHYKTFDSRNKDLINHSPLQNNPEKNNVDKQLSAPYTLEDGPVSPSNFYKLNQGQHPDNPNKYSNASSSHPMYNPSHDHEKFPSNVNDLQYAQPHSQLGLNAAYRPYQNEPVQNGLHPNHNNHYPISNPYNQISPSQYDFDQNHTNPFGHQNMLSDQDGNYPRHPYKLNPMNQNHYQMDPSQNSSSPVVGSDNRVSQYSPLYTSIEQNPANYNAHHNNAPSHNSLGPEPSHQLTSTMPSQDKHPTQMRLPEKEVLSLQDINYNSKYNSKLPRPLLYNIYPATEPNNGVVHSQESNRSPLTGYDFNQNSFKPEHEKNATILDDRRPHNLPYPQFEPNPMYYHNQQFTPPHNGHQSDKNKQQLHSPYEPNQTQTNNVYQPHYPNSPENMHEFGQDDQTQHKNAHLQESLPQSSIGPNQEERLSTLDNNGNRYNLTNSHYKTHSSLTYVTQYVPNHSGQTSDQSPSTSYLDDRFNLIHPSLNSVELKGRGKGQNTEYNKQMNLIRPGLSSIQRGNEVDPTIVKVYQYLNQPKNIYPPKQNENYPHIISHSLLTNNYPALHQENLEDPPRSSMSVEDDKNGIYNSEYPTSLHSQSPVWGSGYRGKNKKPESYPISSPSFYSGQVDDNIAPNNNGSHAHHLPEDSQLSSRYYTPSFQRGQYDKNKALIKNSPITYAEDMLVGSTHSQLPFQTGQNETNKAYIKNSPKGGAEDMLVGSKYNPPSFQIGQYDENKALIKNSPIRYPKDMLVGSKYNPPPFQIGQYDENKALIKNSPSRYPKDMLVGSKYNPPSFQIGQYDENKALIKNSPIRDAKDMLVGSKYNPPSFQIGQYDENKALIKNSPIRYPKDMLVGSKYNPSFQIGQYDENKTLIKNSPIRDAKDMLVGSKHNLPSFQTEQYDKNTDRFNDNPYSHDNIMQPDASPVSSNHTPPLFDSVHYEDNNVPISYNQYAHNDSQPETSPIRPHQKTPLFNLLQFVKKKIPHSYNRNYSKPEVPLNSLHNTSSKWDLDHYKKIFPLDYDPFAHNISQPEASPVVSQDKLPLLYAPPYNKSEVPINYDPRVKNLSQTEGSPINSRYPPYLTPIPYNGTGTLMNKYGSLEYAPEGEQNPLPIWGKNNISQPEALPVNSYDKSPIFYAAQNDKNNVPMNYDPRTHNMPETERYPSNSRYPPYLTPIPYNGTGALMDKFGLTDYSPEVEQNPLPAWGENKISQPVASPVSSHNNSPLFYPAQNEINNVPINYDPRAHNLSQIEAYPSNSNFTPFPYDAYGAPVNTYGPTNHVPEVDQNHLPYPSNFKPLLFDANGKPLNLYGQSNNVSEFDQNHLPYPSNFEPLPFDANGKPLNLHGLPKNFSEFDRNRLPYLSNFNPLPFDANGKPLNLHGLPKNFSEFDRNRLPYPSNFEPLPFDANGKPLNLYGQSNNVSEFDQKHLPYPSNFEPLPFDANGKPLNLHGLPKNFSEFDRNRLPYQSNFKPLPFDANGKPLNLHGLPKNFSEFDRNRLPYLSNFEPLPFDANGKPLNLHGLPKNFSEFDRNRLPYPSNFEPLPFDANGKPLNLHGKPKNFSEFDRNRLPYPSNFEPLPFDANGKPLNLHGLPENFSEFDRNHLTPWGKNNISQTEASPSNSRYPSNFTPYPYDGTGVPIQYGQTNHIPEEEQVSPWAPKSKNTVPIYEQVNIDDIILPETLLNSPYNPFPTLMSEQHEKNKLPNNEYQNNPYKGYDLNVNDNISTLNPLDLTDQQDEIVHHNPSQQQSQTGNFNDHEPVNGFQYISNSAEDPNNSFNKENKYGTNSPQKLDASVLDERGSLDGFQYKSPSDEDAAPKLDNTNSLSVIPHKNKYENYSPYPEQNNDPRSQYKITQNTPVGVNNPGSQEELQNKPHTKETDAFDDRGAHNGFQYISNSDEESQNKSDHSEFKPTSGGKLDNGFLHPPSFSKTDIYSPSPKQEFTTNSGNDTPIIVDVDSINPDILKLLENANKPLSIEDLINKLDSHKPPQLKPNDDSPIPMDLSDDEDELQARFNNIFSDSYPQLQSNKKIAAHPPIDDSEFHLGELDPLELLRLLFPFNFDHAPGKNVEQVPLKDKDLLAMLLGNQNIYNLTKNKTISYKEQYAAQLSNDSSNNSKKKQKTNPQEKPVTGQAVNHVDPRNKGKEVKDSQPPKHQMQQPNITGQAQNPPLQKQTMIISDESLNFPPMQYPDVHIILHHNIGESNALPYLETDVDGDDFFPDLLHSRIKKTKEQIAECGENTKWVRNCHACSCRRGKASCSQIPDCVLRILEEPMMCKPYSKFKMGCYSCECTGDGIPDCDAYDCEIEAKNKESDEDTSEKKPHIYHEFFEDVKAKTMLSYYAFFKKLPKDSSEELNYPTCEAGTQWISNCHNCECKDSLKHECTKIEDCKLDLESLGKPGKCKPNSQFYPKSTNSECQQCSCDDEGNPSCPSAVKKNQ